MRTSRPPRERMPVPALTLIAVRMIRAAQATGSARITMLGPGAPGPDEPVLWLRTDDTMTMIGVLAALAAAYMTEADLDAAERYAMDAP